MTQKNQNHTEPDADVVSSGSKNYSQEQNGGQTPVSSEGLSGGAAVRLGSSGDSESASGSQNLSDKMFYENYDEGCVLYFRNGEQIVTKGINYFEEEDVKHHISNFLKNVEEKQKKVIHKVWIKEGCLLSEAYETILKVVDEEAKKHFGGLI